MGDPSCVESAANITRRPSGKRARTAQAVEQQPVTWEQPKISALRAIDKRYQTSFRYGQMNSPFEYDKVRYIYTESRESRIAE